jgi:hypothetical protein
MKRDSKGRFLPKSAQVAQTPVAQPPVAQPKVQKTETDPVKKIAPLAEKLVGMVGAGVASVVEKALYEQMKNTPAYQDNKATLLALYTKLGMTEMAQIVANDMMA